MRRGVAKDPVNRNSCQPLSRAALTPTVVKLTEFRVRDVRLVHKEAIEIDAGFLSSHTYALPMIKTRLPQWSREESRGKPLMNAVSLKHFR
jgi:hypothetical protein